MSQFTFNKTEKLKSRKLIEHLFKKGKSLSAFPIKLLYDYAQEQHTIVQAGVTVSSRSFKKAVHRNRVKRILREAYRLQKPPVVELAAAKQKQLILFFIYTGKELPVFTEVLSKMEIILQKLQKAITESDK